MERLKALKHLWIVKGAIGNNDDDLKDKIIQLYNNLRYSNLIVPLDNVSGDTIQNLRSKIVEGKSDDELISFLRGRMEFDNPIVFLNYVVHCVKTIDFRKNRTDSVDEYRKRIFSYLYSFYCSIDGKFECLNVSPETVDLVIDRITENLKLDEDISVVELSDFILMRFKKDNPVKSIGKHA